MLRRFQMMKKGLGKGLGALLDVTEEDKKFITEIDLDLIDRDKNQPRKNFKEEEIDELAESIRQNGVLQPIIVRQTGDIYTIVAGERRWRAAKKAKLTTIPVIVRSLTDRQILEISLIENVQRKDLNVIEEASAYKRLSDEYQMTQEEIAKGIGKSRSSVTNKLRILELEREIRQLIMDEKISEGHGRALLSIEDPAIRKRTAQLIVEKNLSVRDIEKISSELKKEKKTEDKAIEHEEEFRYVENLLAKKLGTKVSITRNSNKGKIVIQYYSMEGLNRIIETIRK
jgi:ParB family transcriptional regulator, chromosome partitioning protein